MSADEIRASFVDTFSEDQAVAIENAARGHLGGPFNSTHADDNLGTSPFRYWFLAAVSYECVSRYATDHGITIPEARLRDWALSHGDLGGHDGDVPDYIGLISGAYEGWLA